MHSEWLKSYFLSSLIVNILQFVFSGKQVVNKCYKLAIKQSVLDILHGSEILKMHKKKKALTACYCCN